MASSNEKPNPQPTDHDAHPNPLNGNPNQYYTGSSIYDSTPAPSNNGDAKPQAPVPPTEPLVFLPVHSRPLSSYTRNPNDDAQSRHSSHGSTSTLSRTLKPLHSLAHKLGSESPLPQDLPAEIAKATRILQAFTSDPAVPLAPLPTPPSSRDGTEQYSDNGVPPSLPPRKNHTLLPLPSSVLRSALGVAIFTSLRLGFNMSGSTGSGILLSRLPDGTWSPPSAISVHSLGAGFMAGGDLSDVICVINTHEAMEAFCRAKVTLGTDIGVAAGPYGMGGGIGVVVERCKTIEQQQRHQPQPTTAVEEEAAEETDEKESEKKQSDKKQHKKEKKQRKTSNRGATASACMRTALGRPVYSYVRSRGLYAGLQVDGTVVTERRDANASFYGVRMPASQILAGYVSPGSWVQHVGQLYQVLGDIESRAPALPPRPTTEMSGAGYTDEFYGIPDTAKDQLTEAHNQAAAQDEELPRYEEHEPVNVSDEKREN